MTDGQVSMVKRTARKPHRCIWCEWEIPAGARYLFQVFSYDGRLSNCHWHEACVADSYEVFRGQSEFEFTPGDGEQPFPNLMMIDAHLCALEQENPNAQ